MGDNKVTEADNRCEAAQQAFVQSATAEDRAAALADYREAQEDLFRALEGA